MKDIVIYLTLCPLLLIAQPKETYMVFENGMLTANPAKVTEFEAGLAAHNKKYHAEGLHGARVYWISNGPNIGRYMWVMGPLPWSAVDNRPAEAGHDADWNKNVLAYMLADGDQDYWRFHPELSHFPSDLTLKNLLVFIVDVKRFKQMDFMDKVVKKVQKVYMEEFPEMTYGVYTNEFDNNQGKDFAWVDFYDSTAWLAAPDTFPQTFETVHGNGSFNSFLQDVEDTTEGQYEELWIFREDLSGLGGEVTASSRQ